MPILLATHELQPGMRLHESLMRGGRVLLPGGKELTPVDVETLQRRFPDLHLRVGDPILDEVAQFQDDSPDRNVARTAQAKIADSLKNVSSRFHCNHDSRTINFQHLQQAAHDVMAYLNEHPVSAALLSRELGGDDYLTEHTGNVFYLSMVLGSAVRDYVARERIRQTAARQMTTTSAMNLTPLGLGAMFMDLAMFTINDLLKNRARLNDQIRQLVREHPTAGAEMLPESMDATARMIVRTHHENMDGSGYPNGIAGDKLHVFTRIVRIADSYDAATAQHVYRQAKSPARALWEMCEGPLRRFYDPVLTKMFATLVQVFPIGAKLKLTDGRYAVVVRYSKSGAFSPVVVIAYDALDRRLPADRLEGPFELSSRPDLRLKSFGGENLSYLYQAEPGAIAPHGTGTFNSLYEAVVP